ncbi:transglutaminase family protein [Calycomorphotria hydatis]|uniref:Protein-glutamine gamma-glutamyltransferase n=1 Tax=Calycomorphotria hydatis TaxID=2528027 RepID=A0A517T5V8_9PLAN|nr:transglutaminaseTgpA domain-containing protein [Calycomorphotria hydatis]QDT63748.1 Protein-glutamine gamma-glutamyltransferase [Calycomorphotria hydatis]
MNIAQTFGGFLKESSIEKRVKSRPRTTTRASLEVYVTLLVALGSLMLGLASETAFPSLLTIPLCLLALYVTERERIFGYSSTMANLLSIPALFFAGGELFSGTVLMRLAAGANLLVYLTWIILFQWKENRHYWWLCSLAVLQIAVGAVLTTGAAFGMLLVASVFLTIRTTTYLVALKTEEDFGTASDSQDSNAEPVDYIRKGTAEKLIAPSRVIGQPAHLEAHMRGSRRAFGRAATTVACGSLVLAAIFFIITPRFWIDRLPLEQASFGLAGRSFSGFTESVKLGSFGEILESPEPVLEVKVFDAETDQELDINEYATRLGYDEPLFRGVTMDSYMRGRWETTSYLSQQRNSVSERPPRSKLNSYVRQEIRKHPIGTSSLFAISPVSYVNMIEPTSDESTIYRRGEDGTLTLTVSNSDKGRPVIYHAYSSADKSSMEEDIRNLSGRYRGWSDFEREARHYTQLPRGELRDLRRLAVQIAKPVERNSTQTVMADRIIKYLRDSGEYSYSLQGGLSRSGTDEVEDFLLVRKTGHCEYFASACALLMRAVGIPTRLVSGFKGGSLNSLTGNFEVQQRHAHAWVEARIDGVWTTFDPTPAAMRNTIVAEHAPRIQWWHDLKMFVSDTWRNYVVLLTIEKQKSGIYDPIAETAKSIGNEIAEMKDRNTTRSITAIFSSLANPEVWFSWKGGLLTAVILSVLAFGFLAVKTLIESLRQGKRGLFQQRTKAVEFYQRFRAICGNLGLNRSSEQTEREFAADVEGKFARLELTEEERHIPRKLVEDFYWVRFGERDLNDQRLAEIESELAVLENAVSNSSTHDRHTIKN